MPDLVAWPPPTAPSWPPPPYESFEVGSWDQVQVEMANVGATFANPTNQERQAYFANVRCDEGHTVNGQMVVWPSGVRYPFARCTNAQHQQALVLWFPYYVQLTSDRK